MARMQLNEQEEAFVKKSRTIAQLQAKKRQIVADLDACDRELTQAGEELRALTPGGATTEK